MKKQVTYETGKADSVWIPTHRTTPEIHFTTGDETVIVTITPELRDIIIGKLTAHREQQEEEAREQARKLIQGD